MQSFEKWLKDRQTCIHEDLTPHLLSLYKIYGEECYQRLIDCEAENECLTKKAQQLDELLNTPVRVLKIDNSKYNGEETHYIYLYNKIPNETLSETQKNALVLKAVIGFLKFLPADVRFKICKENFSEFEYDTFLTHIQNNEELCSYPGSITKADGNTVLRDNYYCITPLVYLCRIRQDMRSKHYNKTFTAFKDTVDQNLEKFIITVIYNREITER